MNDQKTNWAIDECSRVQKEIAKEPEPPGTHPDCLPPGPGWTWSGPGGTPPRWVPPTADSPHFKEAFTHHREIERLKEQIEVMKDALESVEKYLVERGVACRGTVGRTIILPKIRKALAQRAATCSDCDGCQFQNEGDPGSWCYMFNGRPAMLPCSQHDKFKETRDMIAAVIRKRPEILTMAAMADAVIKDSNETTPNPVHDCYEESRPAFEAAHPEYDHEMDSEGLYKNLDEFHRWMSWKAALNYAEKQAINKPTQPAPPEMPPYARVVNGNYLPCDYHEDAGHENGSYVNKCRCGAEFIGHKRRMFCRVCAEQPAQPQPETQQSAVEWVKKLLCDGTDLEGNDLAFLLEDNALELALAIDDLRAQLAALRSKQPQP